MATDDRTLYPIGQYNIFITAKIGDQVRLAGVTLKLVDPCSVATININKPASFVDGEYILRDP